MAIAQASCSASGVQLAGYSVAAAVAAYSVVSSQSVSRSVCCCLSVKTRSGLLYCSDALSVDLYIKEYISVTSYLLFFSIYPDNSGTTGGLIADDH